jgi:hypothetical protein
MRLPFFKTLQSIGWIKDNYVLCIWIHLLQDFEMSFCIIAFAEAGDHGALYLRKEADDAPGMETIEVGSGESGNWDSGVGNWE